MSDLPTEPETMWHALRRLTSARIGIGHAGGSLPTREVLDLQLAHARARDAVHLAFDTAFLNTQLHERGLTTVIVHSAAPDRGTYLQRPDLGRQLAPESRCALEQFTAKNAEDAETKQNDVAFVIADGLSSLAIHEHAIPLLDLVLAELQPLGWRIAPIVIAQQSRVALGDEIGEVLGAAIAVILIGERPGLTAADSLGIYLTYGPRVGRSDAERNCISNVRPAGLSYGAAAHTLVYLLREARRLHLSGVELKDDSAAMGMLDVS